MPRIRNNLLMLFSAQRCADVRDRAGREKLQAAALKEVQDVLQAETGKPGVEALYFTSFVTQ
jgi:flagellar FliL protein